MNTPGKEHATSRSRKRDGQPVLPGYASIGLPTNPGRHALASRPHPAALRHKAFTLIELLAVMAIVVLIATLAIVGFTQTSRGRAFQAAISDVHTTLSLARQQAIAKGTPVIFLVCDNNFATRNAAGSRSPEPGIPPQYITGQARTYAVLDAKSRRFLKGWTQLPPGVVFVESPSPNEQDILDESATPPTCQFTNIPYPSVEFTGWSAHALGVAFLSDGSLFCRPSESNRRWRRLGLAEGVASAAGTVSLIPNGQNNAILISLSGVASMEVP